MQKNIVRVIEGGGKGFRRADVVGNSVGQVMQPGKPISNVDELINFAKEDWPGDITAVSISTAGVIEDHSTVIVSPNIHFLDGVNLGGVLTEAVGRPVYVGNDMECSVTGLACLFPALDYFIGMTWSSGIGMRIWKGGAIVSDSEGGHVCIDQSPFAELCGCGRRGCAEAIVGGTGVRRRMESELKARGLAVPDGNLFEFLDREYLAASPWAVDTYSLITTGMGRYLAALQTILHATALVWKGTFARKAFQLPEIDKAIRAKMREFLINPDWERDLKFYFVTSLPGWPEDGESFIGAAKLALQSLE